MLKTIDGFQFKNIIDYGVRHLENNINVINDLNVFPVPDGDTGTNMVLTAKNGLAAINGLSDELSTVAKTFGDAVIFGARGNSGVIFSQFLKGICECLKKTDEADSSVFCEAVSNGVKFAYGAVSNPVEGTILTVIKEASQAVEANKISITSIDDIVSVFLSNARLSLEKTTEMLPALKKAGVVDSGGAGLVCFFEGIQKYLNGETVEAVSQNEAIPSYIDYSVYNKNSKFKFGYCTELLIQLLDCKEDLDINYFRNTLEGMGDSLVTSYDVDKLRVHIHTHTPEQILEFCHRFGEFLSLKIENMTVQHTQLTPKLVCSESDCETAYTTVAVAPNKHLAGIFIDMGADVVMLNEACPATEDFIEAFEKKPDNKIVIFPNDPDSILAAQQAAELYKDADVKVIDCSSVANCYSALATLDFECEDIDYVAESANQLISSIYSVSLLRSAQNLIYGEKIIEKNNFFSATTNEVLFIGDTLREVASKTINNILEQEDYCVITLFYGQNTTEEEIALLTEDINQANPFVEIFTLPTESVSYELTISFE